MAIIPYGRRTDRVHKLTMGAAAITSVASLVYFYHIGAVTAFADGQSRLIIARGLYDSLTNGIAQAGLIWLPMPQFMMFLTAQIDSLYYTGLSGSIMSMPWFLVMVWYLYRLTRLFTGSSRAAFIAVMASITPSLLYIS